MSAVRRQKLQKLHRELAFLGRLLKDLTAELQAKCITQQRAIVQPCADPRSALGHSRGRLLHAGTTTAVTCQVVLLSGRQARALASRGA